MIPIFRKFVFTLLVLTSFACLGNNDRGYRVKIGDMAPGFTMELIDSSMVNLSDFKGKVVMLQFTASWCGVCRKEMPFIETEIWQVLKENPEFALLAIDRDEPRELVASYSKQVGISYPIGLDPEAKIFTLYAEPEAGITRNVIIDRTGKIIYLTRLFEREEFNAMKEVIFKELGLKTN